MLENANELSIDKIAKDYGSLVSSICRRMITNEEMAKDAAQDAWIEIMKSLPSFKGNSKLSTWIYTITVRTIQKYIKDEKIHKLNQIREYLHGEEFTPIYTEDFEEKIWVKDMCNKCLTAMLRCLDFETRLVYIFRDIAALKYDEISHILAKEETAVRKTASRARKKLRSFLNDECVLVSNSPKCNCRIKKWVEKVDLAKEYERIKEAVGKINLYRESETILPRKNYWEHFFK